MSTHRAKFHADADAALSWLISMSRTLGKHSCHRRLAQLRQWHSRDLGQLSSQIGNLIMIFVSPQPRSPKRLPQRGVGDTLHSMQSVNTLEPSRNVYLKQTARRILAGLGGLAALLGTNLAFAESGSPYCRPAALSEVFVGAPGCEDAAYVMLELRPQERLWNYSTILMYLEGPDEAKYFYLQDTVPPDAGAGTYVLIGTPGVERAFGVTPDLEVDELPLSHYSGSIEVCASDVSYHAYAGNHMCAGNALRREDDRWVGTVPDPHNANAEAATRWDCADASWHASTRDARATDAGAGDARIADAATSDAGNSHSNGTGEYGMCDPSVFEAPPSPSTPSSEAPDSSAPEGGTASSEADGSSALTSTLASSSDATPRTSSETEPSAPSSSAPVDDAGVPPADPTQTSTVSCTCHVGSIPRSSPLAVLALITASAGLFRRRFRKSGPGVHWRV